LDKTWDIRREATLRARVAQGGIFTQGGRKRLLGLARPYGGGSDKTLYNYWNRARTYVINALVDLELFIEVADKSQIDKTVTAENIEPILKILLYKPIIETRSENNTFWEEVGKEIKLLGYDQDIDKNAIYDHIQKKREQNIKTPDSNRAEISRLLIKYGFEYLRNMTPIQLLEPSNKLISDAIDLSDSLAQYFKPIDKRNFRVRPR